MGDLGRMLKTHGGPAVEIGAGERDPAVVCALDFDVVEDGEGGASIEDFARPVRAGLSSTTGSLMGFMMMLNGWVE